MAEFMRQRHDVAGFAVEIDQQIRVRGRHGRVREGATRLAGPQPGINPGIVEKRLADIGQLGREAAIGGKHGVARLRPGDGAVTVARQRRIAVPVLQLLQPEPLRLQRIIPMRQPAVAAGHSASQRVYHLVLNHVGPVAVARRARVAAPAVGDLLLLGERIGDQREQLDVLVESLADRVRGLLPHGAVPIRQFVQCRRHGQLLTAHRHAHAGHRLVE